MSDYSQFASTSGTRSSPASPRFPPDPYETESLSSDDTHTERHPYSVSTHYLNQSPREHRSHGAREHHHHYHHHHLVNSNVTSSYQTPIHSRPGSPAPSLRTPSHQGYFFSDEDQPYASLLGRAARAPNHRKWLSESTPTPSRSRRSSGRRRTNGPRTHGFRRVLQVIVNSPFFPSQPATILLSVTIILVVCLSITLFLMYLLNPDKAPLPWRSYCATEPPFPAEELAQYPPVGVFLGVMSTDTAVERRMLIRSTWASHVRSRGTDGSTDRLVVRFILGIPQSDWTRRIQLEAESYKDMIILPVPENMNNGKTHAYISWANEHALVPPPSAVHPHSHRHANLTSAFPSPYPGTSSPHTTATQREFFPSFAANYHAPAPALAPHDPQPHHEEGMNQAQGQADWVRPQFVIKADDDAFVMLSELEARLRLEWYGALKETMPSGTEAGNAGNANVNAAGNGKGSVTKVPVQLPARSTTQVLKQSPATSAVTPYWPMMEDHKEPVNIDPMIYWGYLVKARFMAGELYALSSSLVDYIASTPTIRQMTSGAEDKLTARWIRMHPRAPEVRWRSEHCWIYDHPRAGTVYSHGFLFPSEVTRIRDEITKGLTPGQLHLLPSSPSPEDSPYANAIHSSDYANMNRADVDPSLTHSTVSRFGQHYHPPATNLTTEQEVEALVEGSALSRLRDETVGGPKGEATEREVESAWRRRESRRMRTLGLPASSASAQTLAEGVLLGDEGAFGGTVVVHFIKRNEWFLETAIAFLEDEPDPPPLEDIENEIEEEPTWSPTIGKGGKHGVETDLNGKTPLDLSNLDPEPEPVKSSNHYETDFKGKNPIDLSHLDLEEPEEDSTNTPAPASEAPADIADPVEPEPPTPTPSSPPAADEVAEKSTAEDTVPDLEESVPPSTLTEDEEHAPGHTVETDEELDSEPELRKNPLLLTNDNHKKGADEAQS